MISAKPDRLVDDYLRRLDKAAAHLPRARRAELTAEIRAHIDSALGQEETADESGVRNVLERLGPPEEIVAATEPARIGRLEIGALVALLVPVLGWVVGAALVLVSRTWSQRDKLIGVVLLFLPVVVLGLGLTLAGPSGSEEATPPGDDRPVGRVEEVPPEGLGPIELVLLVNGVPSALYLASRLRTDPRPATLV